MGDEIDDVSDTLRELARTSTSPKELLKAVRERHPKTPKKLIVRAALGSMIAMAERDGDTAQKLQDFAVKSRGDD
jgi:hypothetical protein